MHNLSVEFSYPWLLLLIIPAVLIVLLPYFRLNKRFRKTRNRITSIVLHITVMVLAIALLAGTKFTYEIKNPTNELILLVDVSDTEEESRNRRDEFINGILSATPSEGFNVGVVTFGFDQVNAVPFTGEIDLVYEQYKEAPLPDTSATDIASAIEYTAKLFNNPDSGKIILITDGKETDGTMTSSIKYCYAQNTKLDILYVPSRYDKDDVQLMGMELPEYHLELDENFEAKLTVQSSSYTHISVKLTDNGVVDEDACKNDIELQEGISTLTFYHAFKEEGLHKVQFDVTTSSDGIIYNNTICSFYNVLVFNKVLLVSRDEEHLDQSDYLNAVLTENEKYVVTTVTPRSADFPSTIEELCNYDQVILNNISNTDIMDFVPILYDYVYERGGGLFTIGGSDGMNDDGKPLYHAYSIKDMPGTLFQSMLPIQVTNYTPPVGVIVIVDRSGSMDTNDVGGEKRLDAARACATTIFDSLEERDYFGLMTLESNYHTILPLTRRTEESKIKQAIASIDTTQGGTRYSDAIGQACTLLANPDIPIDRRHVVIVSDGQITGQDQVDYEQLIDTYHRLNGTTFSVVLVGARIPSNIRQIEEQLINGELNYAAGDEDATSVTDAYIRMLRAVWIGNDTDPVSDTVDNYIERTIEKRKHVLTRLHAPNPDDSNALQKLLSEMRIDINSKDIKQLDYEPFNPSISNLLSPLLEGVTRVEGDVTKIDSVLDGFYGVKKRENAEVVLKGDFDVPIYAQWKFGEGMVGSFMCDLYGEMSSRFIYTDNAKAFILNVVKNLMNTKDLSVPDFSYKLTEDNYTNKLSVFAKLNEGERIEGSISWTEGDKEVTVPFDKLSDGSNSRIYVRSPLDETTDYSRCVFIVKDNGVYKIKLSRVDKDGNVLSTTTFNKSFSYSEEYDKFNQVAEADIKYKLYIATEERGVGQFFEEIPEYSEFFKTFITDLKRIFDPRVLFAIIIIVLFLLEIIVRKFKFKWIHELVRDHKNKKQQKPKK